MKNYLSIGEAKFELSPNLVNEILKIVSPTHELKTVGVGQVFKIGEYEFIVLEHSLENEKTIVLLKNLLFEEKRFGENNNYDGSTVDSLCNDFADEIKSVVGDALCEFTLDLTADDGLKCYGSIKRKMALLTANMCRKYVDILDEHKIENWWWTSTAYSTPKHENESWIKCVSPRGDISNDIYNYMSGVRPFCILKSNIFVSK